MTEPSGAPVADEQATDLLRIMTGFRNGTGWHFADGRSGLGLPGIRSSEARSSSRMDYNQAQNFFEMVIVAVAV